MDSSAEEKPPGRRPSPRRRPQSSQRPPTSSVEPSGIYLPILRHQSRCRCGPAHATSGGTWITPGDLKWVGKKKMPLHRTLFVSSFPFASWSMLLSMALILMMAIGQTSAVCDLDRVKEVKHRDCHDMEIFDIDDTDGLDKLGALDNCTMVVGRLHFKHIHNIPSGVLAQYSFPKLREITGHLMITDVSGLHTLQHLFPNLAVIGGDSLFANTMALAVMDMPDMEELGLVSLTTIRHGNILLTENPKLCHVHSVDWERIAPYSNTSSHLIMHNMPQHLCLDNCSASSFCNITGDSDVLRRRCWSARPDGCQKNLGCSCSEEDHFCDQDGHCCHRECIGGCSGPSANNCFACRHVALQDECRASCPSNTFLFSDQHRCLTVNECLNLTPMLGRTPKILNETLTMSKKCVYDCPPGFMESQSGDDNILRCVRCEGHCHKPCDGMDIYNNVSYLKKLENCTVIEGSLNIKLINLVSQEIYNEYRFPHLREITGHLMMFRVFGLRTLRNMFPNLAVIRGETLFFNYALIIMEMRDLEELGLVSLTTISNGAVRLTKSYKLCYVNTIDWSKIATGVEPSQHQFQNIRAEEMCPNYCSESCDSTTYNGNERRRCWTSKDDDCQKNLKCKCEYGQPCQSNGRCCYRYCIGGCSGPNASDCFVCKHVLLENQCRPACTSGTYKLANRRCLRDKECLNLKSNVYPPKILEGSSKKSSECLYKCPEGYAIEKPINGSRPTHCVICKDFCPKVCQGDPRIFSVKDSEKFRDCSKIEGSLEIQINGGDNIDNQLTLNLGTIREVTGYVKVIRSYALLTLHFFKSLEIIGGKDLTLKMYSLLVIDNLNLEELFPQNQMSQMVIRTGRIGIHLNRRVCMWKIDNFIQSLMEAPMHNETGLVDLDISNITNGDLTPCVHLTLNLSIVKVYNRTVQFTWTEFRSGYIKFNNSSIETGDTRRINEYTIFYQATTENITDVFQGKDACSENDWNTVSVAATHNSSIIHHLEPFTRYAIYIQANTLPSAGMSGRSSIVYFTTKPERPTMPLDLQVSSNSYETLDVKWKPPKSPNGIVTNYKVFFTLQIVNVEKFEQRDYCIEPISPVLEERKRARAKKLEEENQEKKARKGSSIQQCGRECKCPTSYLNDEKSQRDQQKEADINFEDKLILNAYTKPSCQKLVYSENLTDSNISLLTLSSRVRRSVNASVNASDVLDTNSMTSAPPTDPIFETEMITVYDTKVTLRGLKHFTHYLIEVVACHNTDPMTGIRLCGDNSTSAQTAGQTKPDELFDKIDMSNITVVQNKNGKVDIYWQPPLEPNGLVLKYFIKYQRISPEPASLSEELCLSRQLYANIQGYAFKNLEPGKYSFQLSAYSLAGNGSYTEKLYFSVAGVSDTESNNTYVVGVAIGILVLIIGMIVLLCCCYGKWKQRKEADIVSSNPHYLHTDDMYLADEWEVDREDIRLIKELGQGSFGMVFEGTMEVKETGTSTRVAIKTVNDQADFIERLKILKEATTMKVFECHHVVKLLGVVSKSQPALVILELMLFGDLRNYLRRCREEEEDYPEYQPPSSNKIRQMAGEIADGMAYLADKKIVHRDLAARNCLVAEDTTVKIADFGMARDVYLTEYYRKDQKALLPIRWMAPESLRDGVFTTMSDIWSYGIVLWEMVTLAEQPYQGLGNEQVLKFVTEGYIMNEPEGCPEDLFEMMRMCWAFNPRNRPTFKCIIEMLVPYLNNRFHKVSYFFQEVLHSDGEDNVDDRTSNNNGANEESFGEAGNCFEDYEEPNTTEEDQARFEEEKLIKGNYNLYACSSGDEEASVGYPITNLSPPASAQLRFMPPSTSRSFSLSPSEHHASPKVHRGRQSSPTLDTSGLHQPLLYSAASPYATKDHYLSNSPEILNTDYMEPSADGNFEDGLDSLHIEEDMPSSERLKLLPKSDNPRSHKEQRSSGSLSKLPTNSTKAADPKSDPNSQYTLMFSPAVKNLPSRQGEIKALSPFSPSNNPTALHPPPVVPSSSSSSPTSPSSTSPYSSPHTAATSCSVNPPFSLAPLVVSPIAESPSQVKSKPTLHVTTEDLYPQTRNGYSSRPSDNRQSGSDLNWHDAFQNNNRMVNNGEGGNSGRGCLYSNSDVDSITSGSRDPSEESGSKESSSSAGSHHHISGSTANGHGPYSHQQAALC